MSSSRSPVTNLFNVEKIAEFQYRQMPTGDAVQATQEAIDERNEAAEASAWEVVWTQRIATECAAAAAAATSATEARLRIEYEQRAQHEASRISTTIEAFDHERKAYFSRVEAEIVQLSLAIAAKILHRESQVEPLLLAAVVQIALNQLKEGSVATLRVWPGEAKRWSNHFNSVATNVTVTVLADVELEPGDCVLETELGSVNFSLDKQLKEVEQGFFDILAQKPQA